MGLFGVIGSLIFVGLHLRQTRAVALSETYQNRAATSLEAGVGLMSSPAALSGVSLGPISGIRVKNRRMGLHGPFLL